MFHSSGAARKRCPFPWRQSALLLPYKNRFFCKNQFRKVLLSGVKVTCRPERQMHRYATQLQ